MGSAYARCASAAAAGYLTYWFKSFWDSQGYLGWNDLLRHTDGRWLYRNMCHNPDGIPEPVDIEGYAPDEGEVAEILAGPDFEQALLNLRCKYRLNPYPTYEAELCELRARHGLDA